MGAARVLWGVVLIVATSGVVMAHPGHGTGESTGVAHYATEPVHVLPIVLVAAVCGLGWMYLDRAAKRR
ncbi:MAG: hypothetical protein KDA66_19750 [Planctomycetaceae bacterium]|nr:hypothetical protein [Planctomycetaceae bacterium]